MFHVSNGDMAPQRKSKQTQNNTYNGKTNDVYYLDFTLFLSDVKKGNIIPLPSNLTVYVNPRSVS